MRHFGLALSLLSCGAFAQGSFTPKTCDPVTESQFSIHSLVGKGNVKSPDLVDPTFDQPLKMAFDMLPDSSIDIYIALRKGDLRKYNTVKKTIITVGKIPTTTGGETAFTGIALDPKFKTTHDIFVYYCASGPSFKLSRVKLNVAHTQFSTGTFATSETSLLTIPAVGENHTGSGMAFDSYGDLWVTVGKNATDYPNSYDESDESRSSEKTSSNAADLRGSILRIHPDAAAADGYTIPAGNYGAYWAAQFKTSNPTLSDEYANTTKVKPEIYVKGMRNPYSISVHPTKRWASVGMFNINTTQGWTETHYLFTHASNGGYPYFTGGGYGHDLFPLWSNTKFGQNGANVWNSAHSGMTEDPNAPMNNSKWNKGPKQLPPVTPALHTYLHDYNTASSNGAGAIAGPIYQYAAGSTAKYKLPSHFQDAWFTTDYVQGYAEGIRVYKVNDSATAITDSLVLFANKNWFSFPLDLQQGPDGALYVANYGSTRHGSNDTTAILRIEYNGPGCSEMSNTTAIHSPAKLRVTLATDALQIDEAAFTLVLKDVRGRTLFRASETAAKHFSLAELCPQQHGLVMATVATAQGSNTYKIIRP